MGELGKYWGGGTPKLGRHVGVGGSDGGGGGGGRRGRRGPWGLHHTNHGAGIVCLDLLVNAAQCFMPLFDATPTRPTTRSGQLFTRSHG
jgi:hypothetical protein